MILTNWQWSKLVAFTMEDLSVLSWTPSGHNYYINALQMVSTKVIYTKVEQVGMRYSCLHAII